MLTIIVWTNIIVIEIGFIVGAALLLSKASHEENSTDPGRFSMTEVSNFLPIHLLFVFYIFHKISLK